VVCLQQLTPGPVAKLGGTDTLDSVLTLCHVCHPAYEKAARTLTLPVETPPASKAKRTPRRRNDAHGTPFRGPDGQPWRDSGTTTRGLM
jgi:hypothetical protein